MYFYMPEDWKVAIITKNEMTMCEVPEIISSSFGPIVLSDDVLNKKENIRVNLESNEGLFL